MILTQKTKVCTKCGERKSLDNFGLQSMGRFGRRAACKTCTNEGSRAKLSVYRAAHPLPAPRTLAERFLERVDMRAGLRGCWPWLGLSSLQGYGLIHTRAVDGTWAPELAHRVAWKLATGRPIPPDDQVCHKKGCTGPLCVRPDHLFLGGKAEQAKERAWKGRWGSLGGARGEKNHSAKLTVALVEEMRTFLHRDRKMNIARMARFRSVSLQTAWRAIRGKTWKHLQIPPIVSGVGRPRGEMHGNAKLSERSIYWIRLARSRGYSPISIAKVFCVSERTVRDAVAGRTWSHILRTT